MTMLKIKKIAFLILIGILLSFHGFSQVDSSKNKMEYPDHTLVAAPPATEEIFYKGSLQAGGGIVYVLSNKALRMTLGGDYEGHFSGNYVLAPHIYGGLELENAQFGNTEYGANINTIMIIYNAGIKMGYYTYMQNDFLFCYSISGGPSLITFSKAPKPAPKGGFKTTSFFITPNFLASYRVNNELRIGLDFTYGFMGYRFDPAWIGLDQMEPPDYNTSWAKANVMYFEWGFGIYWAFAEGKRK